MAPPAATSFLTSDAAVYLFFNATVSSSDSLSSDWLAPDGSVFPGSTWNAQAGAFCFSSSALAIGNTPENRLGTWQARVYDNGAPLFSVTFSVSAAPSSVGGPSSGVQLFPHLAATSEWQTEVFILNPSDVTASFNLVFHTDGGAPLQLEGNSALTQLTLAPNATAFFRTAAKGNSTGGWVEVQSATTLAGVAVYRRHASDGKYYEASVPLSTAYSSFVVPFDESQFLANSQFVDGFAVANADTQRTAQVTCSAYSASGDALQSSVQIASLNPGQHTALLLDQKFGSALSGRRGTLVCQANTPVAALELRSISAALPAVSSMPVIPQPGAASANGVLMFPHLAATSEWQTEIFILNPTNVAATYSLVFHSDNPPLQLDSDTDLGDTMTLEPNALAFFKTALTGNNTGGWIEVDSTAPLAGVAVYRRHASDGKYYEASAPLGPAYTSFAAPYDETSSPAGAPFVDGFAVANPDSRLTAPVSCTAYNASGQILSSNLEVASLRPEQHAAFLLDQRYGGALAASRGMLVCQSTLMVSSMEVRSVSAALPAVSSMPVIPNVSSALLVNKAGTLTITGDAVAADLATDNQGNPQYCTAPTPKTSFLTTDQRAVLWLAFDEGQTGDQLAVQWIPPTGPAESGSQPVTLNYNGAGCYAWFLGINGTTAASAPGQWQAKLLVNGVQALTVPFTINKP